MSQPKVTEERVKRWLTEAEGYIELGLFEQAMKRLDRVEATPHFPFERALLRASVHREREEFAAAVPCFEQALRAAPGSVPATVGLGWCLKRAARLPEAVAAYREALKRHPDEALLHYNLACYLSLLGQAPDALRELDLALQLDDSFRALARDEQDFGPLRQLPEFQERIMRPGPELV